jgi:sugar lactone lactonase YvrE
VKLSGPPALAPLGTDWDALVTTIGGDGIAGWRDGSRARFSDPFGIAVAPNGTVYVADAGDSQRIRAIAADGLVSTIAGGRAGFADGPAAAARFDTPSGLAVDVAGNVYVADTGNNAVRRIAADGQVSTVAGGGPAGYLDGPAGAARFNGPVGIAVHTSGRVIVADTYNDRIRSIAPNGIVSTMGPSPEGPPEAHFNTPSGVAVDPAGRIYVADTGNGLVRRLDPSGVEDTPPWMLAAGIARPIAIAVGGDDLIYVADEAGRVVELSARGQPRVLAGSTAGYADGEGRAARFRRPSGVAWAGPGRLFVADSGNALIRLIEAQTRAELRLPPPPGIRPAFEDEGFARHPLLWPVPPMEGPHEIAGTLGEARGSEGSERFHAGVDVRVPQGTPVLAVRDAVVASPVSTGEIGGLNEWLRIGPVAYVHVRAGRRGPGRAEEAFDPERFVAAYDETGRITGMRVKRGARFVTGEVIASVNAFNHVHLNVGWAGEELNPLRFRIPHFEDSVPPTIARNGIRLFDEGGQPLSRRERGRLIVAGRVRIVVDAWDQADGNRPGRRLGLYGVGYEILDAKGQPVPGGEEGIERLRFDRLLPGPEAPRLVYAPGSGIPFYGRRVTRFLYSATSSFRGGIAENGFWDTRALAPGPYTVRIRATDVRGNMAVANRDLPVIVLPPATETAGDSAGR